MILQLFRKEEGARVRADLRGADRSRVGGVDAPRAAPAVWGPEKIGIPECEVDLRLRGRIYIVMEASEGMGKYQVTRWPLEGTFTHIEPQRGLVYEARSWTEGEQDPTFIEHINELELSGDGDKTVVNLRITINEIGSGRRGRPSV